MMTIFWSVAAIFVVGHILLLRAAWRLRADDQRATTASTGTMDLGWSIVTAAASAALLATVYMSIAA